MNDTPPTYGPPYKPMTYDRALELEQSATTDGLCAMADTLRRRHRPAGIELCSIMNARSGRCTEDCKWCSQSRFHHTDIEIYSLVSAGEALELARRNERKGVARFSLVASGRTLTAADTRRVCAIYRELAAHTKISLCASLGLLDKSQLEQLRASGVTRYHCNLESAPSHFPTLCSTHTITEKMQTLRWAQEAGLEICSGGIIGIGETMAQRIELALALREAGVVSIPVNILNPIPGTPLEGTSPLSDDEVLRSIAMFRIINPTAAIRLAGGRALIKHLEHQLFRAGVDSVITGDMLTTVGSDIDADIKLTESI